VKNKKTSIEKVNLDACVQACGNSRFNLVLVATARAREIANKRNNEAREGTPGVYENKPVVEALCEIASGKI